VQNRAWSTLEIKAVDREQRIIEGIASTPEPDNSGHVMVPAGAQFALPVPFLWFHNQKDPIGEVFEADVRPEGIYIKARVSTVTTLVPCTCCKNTTGTPSSVDKRARFAATAAGSSPTPADRLNVP